MQRLLLMMLLGVYGAGAAHAQAPQLPEIGVGLTGEAWAALRAPKDGSSDWTVVAKLATLKGIYDGAFFGEARRFEVLPQGIRWNTVIDALDQFFQDATNRNVFVFDALGIVKLRMDGGSQSVVDAAIQRARCRGAALSAAVTSDEQVRRFRNC